MNNASLGQLQTQITQLRDRIEQFFKTVATPDNTIVKRDPFWGQRQMNIHIRLDEFSINKLEKLLPQLHTMFNEFKTLRAREKELTEQILIERAIEHTNNPVSTIKSY